MRHHIFIRINNLERKIIMDDYICSYSPKFTNPAQYLKAKLKILSRDFKITPTETELEHLRTLTTEIGIDNAILSIINHHWS